MNKKALKAVFLDTVPVLTGYLFWAWALVFCCRKAAMALAGRGHSRLYAFRAIGILAYKKEQQPLLLFVIQFVEYLRLML